MPLPLVYGPTDLFNQTDVGLFPIDPCMETIAATIVEEAKALLNRNPTAVMQTRPAQAALFEGRSRQFISDGNYALCESKGARVVNSELSARDAARIVLNGAYKSAEDQKDFPQYDHFANLFEKWYFREALNGAVTGAIMHVRPFQLEDQPIYEGAEDEVD
ncbi:uncharacterized protein ARMOST_07932 [Armillaria ostoyae]|uniref:Uncharacterized protein n=1 Tax=Armillaria ostoyae TaxID=47428 RepID=A0A284R763_ARMOS|nr:uncharacterized protein ARMOST_07932 [Armillaria ostoyae]